MVKKLTYVEIDVSRCSLTYGSAPCTASVGVTGDKKCFNSKATCQDRENYGDATVTLRFSFEGAEYQPDDIEAIPCVTGISISPGEISLGGDLGERASVSISFKDLRHSDTGPAGDKYLADRSYNPFTQGTYWGRFRTRHRYIRGQPIRIIRGNLGQALGDMETRHYVVDSFSGPSADGSFTIVAKDVLKLADDDRAKAPLAVDARLTADATAVATSISLNPSGIGNLSFGVTGYATIAGKEVVSYTRTRSWDTFTKLLLNMNGSNGGTTFTDSSSSAHTVTRAGNTNTATAQKVFGTASGLFDGTGDYLTLDGSSEFAFGEEDFTIDLRFLMSAVGAARTLIDFRPASTDGLYPRLHVNASNKLIYHTNSADRITGTTTIAINTWYHAVVTRKNGITRMFLNGTLEGSRYRDTNVYLVGASRPIIGANGSNTANENYNGYIDEVEISNGVARWWRNFTSAAAETGTSGGDTLTITRGLLGSTAIAHKQDDRVQPMLRYVSADPADVAEDLFVNYAGMDPDYIDLDSWLTETTAYLGRLYSANIAEPTGVRKLVSELIEQACLAMWWDDLSLLIRLQVLRAVPTSASIFDEDNTIAGSLQISEQPDKRLTEVQTYFDQRNPCEPLQEDNFKSVALTYDGQRQTDYGSAAIKKILSRWIPNGGRAIALRINDIQLARYKDPPRRFAISLFPDTSVQLGGGYRLGSWAMQTDEGEAELASVQIVRMIPSNEMISVEAEEVLFDIPADDLDNRVIILDTDQNNVNIETIHDTLYPAITTVGSITLTIVVDTGIVIGSNSTALPAMDIGSFTSGLPITLQVKGRIQGAGGNGGSGHTTSPTAGGAGGTALYTRQAIDIDLTTGDGEIWGGGGGGGGSKSIGFGNVPGGGGGAGTIGGTAGFSLGTPSTNGTDTAGGTTSASGVQGDGGGPGTAGQTGASGAAGGAAGNAIDGDSYCTITGTGDVLGPTIN